VPTGSILLVARDEGGIVSVRLRDLFGGGLGEMRHEPTAKRVRARLDGLTVVDSERAVLVWEPRRVVPTYAVPAADIVADLAPAPGTTGRTDEVVGFALPELTDLPVYDPRVPFDVRVGDGERVHVRAADGGRVARGFRSADPDLADLVILDFAGFDQWLEDGDEVLGHPRDPYHRIDVRTSSRPVQWMLDGEVLARSTRARIVYETMLPERYYVPEEDVVAVREASPTETWCAYKGKASYWSVDLPGGRVDDLVWGYRHPLPDAAQLAGYVTFFGERSDLVVDGVARARPTTPWS
jgi:uncharacterized protein (DUF427 family)